MIAFNLVGTNKNSGTKTFNTNFLRQLELSYIDEDILIYVSKSYINNLETKVSKKIQIKIKSDLFENFIIRFLWMQFYLPIELKIKKVKVLFSSNNYSPFIIKYLNIKSVLFVHTVLPWHYFNLLPGNSLKKYFIKKIMEISILNSEIIIVPSKFAKKMISNNLKVNPDQIKVIFLGADHISNTSQTMPKLENFNYEDKYFLSVLSCVRYHNIIKLLKAYKAFTSVTSFEIRFVIVLTILDQDYFNEIKDFISKNFTDDKVLILPNLENDYLKNIYKNSLLYLFTSYSETFGFTSLEAMFYNKPLIVSKTSALEEINGDIPEYFDPDDVEEIKFKLLKVINENNFNNLDIDKKAVAQNQFKKYKWKKTFDETFLVLKNLIN